PIRLSPDDVTGDDAAALRMSTQQDVTEARRAAQALTSAVERLRRSHPDSLDLRRLVEDVARVSADLDLLAGVEPAARRAPSVVPAGGTDRDPGYDPREFVDGSYEGTTPR